MSKMITVNVHDAKTQFSRLLCRVEGGEEIIIAKAGKPVARVVPLKEKTGKRIPGSAKRRIKIEENFLEPLPKDILEAFE